jgi:hypothetical protein
MDWKVDEMKKVVILYLEGDNLAEEIRACIPTLLKSKKFSRKNSKKFFQNFKKSKTKIKKIKTEYQNQLHKYY